MPGATPQTVAFISTHSIPISQAQDLLGPLPVLTHSLTHPIQSCLIYMSNSDGAQW